MKMRDIMKIVEGEGTYSYHSTNAPLHSIVKDGLRSAEWEDEELEDLLGPGIHHLLFYTDRPQTEYGDNVLRFPSSAPGVADDYSPDRGSFYHSPEPFSVAASALQVQQNGKWVPLVKHPK